MRRLGLKHQVLLITLIPVFLIDLFFTFRHVDSGIDQATELLEGKGRVIARQIAGASEFNLFTGNDRQIQYLLDQSVNSNDIVQASVYDRNGNLVAGAVADDFQPRQIGDYLYFRQPILSQSTGYADVFAPDYDESAQVTTLGWVHLYLSQSRLQTVTRQIIVDSIVFFIAILVLAVLLTIVVSRRITRPIFDLMEHLKLVETGQLGKTIEPTEANEIGAVQRGFNRMTQALMANRRHLNQRIQQATQQLNQAITELESRNRELGFARDEALNANRVKSEFIANMSHEIRTPINGIKGFISLLGQSRLSATQRRYVDIIQKSTVDLTNIINEILDFSKMESGKLHIVEEAFDLHEVIEQTRDILFINVLTKNVDLHLVIYSDTPRSVVGDKLRLKQILLNLIGNAIKFTDQGEVVVRVSLLEQVDEKIEIEISIRDTGIGIAEADQRSLFKAFSQVDNPGDRRLSGTGLGLVISKNLAKLMGGDIRLDSSPGVGSEFILKLPFRVLPAARRQSAVSPMAALIFAATSSCLMEIRTLFDRAGVTTETSLVDNDAGAEPLCECIQRNLAYVDLLVFDLRHLQIDLNRVLDMGMSEMPRVILMDYDQSTHLDDNRYHAEFLSVITTARALEVFLSQRDETGTSRSTEIPTAPLEPKRVLLVDDNRVNLKLGSELIRLWGHDVVEAENGNQALQIYDRESFDLIILDIQMPDIDGATLLQMMRERKPGEQTPVAALTANIMNDEADRLLGLGFDYFLGKPIDEDRFRALLDGELGSRLGDDLAGPAAPPDDDCALDYRRSLALSANNEALLRQILEILQRDIPDYQQQLETALQRDDLDRLAAIAHKLHGVTCYASLPRLRHRVVGFQHRCAHGDSGPVEPLVADLVDELARVKREVDRLLAQLSETRDTA